MLSMSATNSGYNQTPPLTSLPPVHHAFFKALHSCSGGSPQREQKSFFCIFSLPSWLETVNSHLGLREQKVPA